MATAHEPAPAGPLLVRHKGPCYVCGTGGGEPDRLATRFTWDEDQQLARVTATLGPLCQGAPGYAHGGSLFALLDEAMGLAAWMGGHKVLSARVTIDYRKPVPLGSEVDLVARVDRVDGRKVHTRGELRVGGEIATEATGLFVASDRHAWDLLPFARAPDT